MVAHWNALFQWYASCRKRISWPARRGGAWKIWWDEGKMGEAEDGKDRGRHSQTSQNESPTIVMGIQRLYGEMEAPFREDVHTDTVH